MRGLFLRIFLWFCGGMLVLVGVVSIALWITMPDIVAAGWRRLGRGAIVSSARLSVEAYERGGAAELTTYFRALHADTQMNGALLDAAGTQLGGFPIPGSPSAFRRVAASPAGRVAFPGGGIAAVPIRGPSSVAYVFLTTLPPREEGVSLVRGAFVAVLLMGGFACYLLARHLTSPVVHLRTATSRFASGDLTSRITLAPLLERKDELGGLARDFNQMAQRIEMLMRAQARLLADVSHELRSPLTRLSLALGLIGRQVGDGPQIHIRRMEREVTLLNGLIQRLLTLSRLECATERPPMEPVDLTAVLQSVVVDAAFEAQAAGRAVRLLESSPCTVLGVRELLASAMENVIRNAVRYTAPQSEVEVRLSYPDNAHVTITIADRGPGVPDEDLPHLFKPFYRSEEARERQSGGAGLGLAIAQQVASLHWGFVEAVNRPAGGLEVRIHLPAERG